MNQKFTVTLVFVLTLGTFLLASDATGSSLFAAEFRQRKPLKPEEIARIAAKVLPKDGYTLRIKWRELGPKLVKFGVIDLAKFRELYKSDKDSLEYLRYLQAPSDNFIAITPRNAGFLVNVFWALGLANRNPLLENLAAKMPERELMRLASTGGWTLGTKPPEEFYSAFDIIRLTPHQQKLVAELAGNIYRPCCNNATALPDCNHGIALLGLIELMSANGFEANEILRASLQFNAFWFPEQYVKTALLFQLRGIDWTKVDPKQVLGSQYSSAGGWMENVNAKLQKEGYLSPGQKPGSSC